MIEALGPFTVDGMGFAFLAALCVLTAWYARAAFPLVLAGASLAMVANWLHPLDMLVLALFLILPYGVARWAWGRPERGHRWPVAAAIAAQLAAFVVVKGYPGAQALQPWSQPVAVVGLSYLLFRQIHLMIEAPNFGTLPLTPMRYLTWSLAFWTLLAGPIQRYEDFVAGMGRIHRPRRDEALAAAHRTVNGFFKAFVFAPLFLAPSKASLLAQPGAGWLDAAVVFYAFPMYLLLNFSGYTDMVIGVARLCGFTTLPENFDRPFLARNLQDFWGRWHMSFGVWIRDYLFSPLSLAIHRRVARGLQGPALLAAVLITFLVVGAWHGTTASFFVFGLLHGFGVAVVALWDGFLKDRLGKAGRKAFVARPVVRIAATVLTFHFVAATMILMNNPLGEAVAAMTVFLAR